MRWRLFTILATLSLVLEGAQDRDGTLVGNIDLLPGYVDQLKPGVFCYDSNCGQIWKPAGLTIDDELDNGGYELDDDRDVVTYVYCQDRVSGQVVEFAWTIDQDPKRKQFSTSYPQEATFNAEVRGQGICAG